MLMKTFAVICRLKEPYEFAGGGVVDELHISNLKAESAELAEQETARLCPWVDVIRVEEVV